MHGQVARRVWRLERHALGPRVYLIGVRIHDWHLGLLGAALYVIAVAFDLVRAGSVPGLTLVGAAAWLVLKDWRDLFPTSRDSAAWRLGIHRRPTPLRALRPAEPLPALAALIVAGIGSANVVWALSPGGSWLDDVLPPVVPLGSTPILASAALPLGTAFLVGAFYLLHRRRRAWELTVAVLVLVALLELARGLHLREAALSLAAAGLLWWGRDTFCVPPREPAPRLLRRVGVLAGVGFATLLAIVAAVVHIGPAESVRETLALLGWHPALPVPVSDEAGALPLLTRLAALLVLLASAYLSFRAPALPRVCSGSDRDRARRLVRMHGSDTLAFFKLRRDAHRLFSSDGQAFLAYRVEAGALVVSADPVGSELALPDLLRRTCALAEQHDLRLAVLGASEQQLALYRRAGLRAFYLGDEAIVETRHFTLEGRAMRKVRQSVARLERAGYTFRLQPLRAFTSEELDRLDRVSDAWRHGQPERGFAMALDELNPDEHAETLVAIALDPDQRVRGFLHFVPTYGRAAMSLSAMRRELQTPNGLTEFLVARSLDVLRDRGITEVSLNFAAFARAFHGPRDLGDRLLARLLALPNRYFQIESLYRFNAKFFPRWEPRYLVYEGRLGLPRAALAALWAEGQLPRPHVKRPNVRLSPLPFRSSPEA